MDNPCTIIGNLTDDPELRFTPSGKGVVNFTVAVNSRVNESGEWKDKLEGFFRCNAWGDMAENVAGSLTKGSRVVVAGKVQQRSWEDNDGNKRSAFEILATDVGASLKWATATPQKAERSKEGSF